MDNQDRIELNTRRSEAESCRDACDFDMAIRIHQGIIADYRDDDQTCEQAYANMGEIHLLLREIDLAENSYLLALSYNPQNPRYHYWLGFVRLFCGYRDEAITELTYCVEHDPNRFEYHWVLSLFYWDNGNRHKAVKCLKRALSITPVRVGTVVDLGIDLLYLPDYNIALEFARHSVLVTPESRTAWKLERQLMGLQGVVKESSPIQFPQADNN